MPRVPCRAACTARPSASRRSWAAAAAVGLAAALQRWDAAFTVVRLAGAAYLVVLGGQALWAHRRSAAVPGAGAEPAAEEAADRAPLGPVRAFRQGLLSCLLN